MVRSIILVSFPQKEEQSLHWWHVEDRALVAQGCDQDPMAAAGILSQDDADNTLQVVALVPSTQSTVRWHRMPEGATEKQALVAAILEAKTQSLKPEGLHVVAARDGESLVTAAVAFAELETGLANLQFYGIDPDIIIPAGFLLGDMADRTIAVDLGFDRILRGPELIAVDEPLVRNHLVSTETVEKLAKAELEDAIASAAFPLEPNLRRGAFAKATKQQLSSEQKKNLTWLIAALLLTSIVIPLLQFYKYHSAASKADDAAMAAALKVAGPAEDLEIAERQLDERLRTENLGNNRFTVPASALFSGLQKVPGVSVSRLSYGGQGLLSVELTAVRNEDINPVLIDIQNKGFDITATPRQDASGMAKADVTVRLP